MSGAPKDLVYLMQHPEEVEEALAFLEALKNLKAVTDQGEFPLQLAQGATNCVLDLRALTATGVPVSFSLPAAGADGSVLISSGTSVEWYPS